MKKFQDLLDALSTIGGGILILFVLVIVFGLVLVHVEHHHDSGEIVTIMTGGFSGVLSALLLALKGNSSKQQMVDRMIPTPLATSVNPPTEPKP